MTTAQFIEQTYNTEATRERRCSSVFTDYKGQVYSYGYHYPLAFNIKGLDFINTQGYSNTTAKHISWAWRAVGYHANSVKLWREDARVISDQWATEADKLAAVKQALQREIDSLRDQMESKKRKNTQVYSWLEQQHDKAAATLAVVEAA